MRKATTKTKKAAAPKEQAMVAKWMSYKSADCDVIDAGEFAYLEALVLHVASTSHQPSFRVERELADHFAVPNLKFLPVSAYEAAIQFIMTKIPAARAA